MAHMIYMAHMIMAHMGGTNGWYGTHDLFPDV